MNKSINKENGQEKLGFPPRQRIVGPGNLVQYFSPTPNEIPIIASTPYSPFIVGNNPDMITKEMFTQLHECGFNVGMELINDKLLDKILDVINGTGVKFMPASSLMHKEGYQNFINKYKDNTNIGGWNYVDEPLYSELDKIAAQYSNLRKVDPNKLFLINLIGSEIFSNTGGLSYSDYLDLIQSKFTPGVWSYDLYPISVQNGSDTMTRKSVQLFYDDFQYFSNISKKTGRPFWAFCQSMAFKTKDGERPAPKEQYLRYEAFSALACGAQGIIYWTYAQRMDKKSTDNEIIEEYTTALINSKGNKTIYWYYAQKVNNEIKKFTDVFLGAELIRIGHVGNLVGVDNFDYADFGPLNAVNSTDEGALITLLQNGNKSYLVIVNHSPFRKNSVRIAFKKNALIRLLNPASGTPSNTLETPPNFNINTLSLQAGNYLIYAYRLLNE